MNETFETIRRMAAEHERGVVATIVRTRGSTPREVGARMVVRASGEVVGTVGGGCGEAEVWSEAMSVLETALSKLIEVDLVHDDDAEGGRACGGIMYVFLEPIAI